MRTGYYVLIKRLVEYTEAPDWSGALCDQKTGLFYPESPRRSERERQEQAAKQICTVCPLKEQCLEYALENDEDYGVWGGKTEKERRMLKRRRITRPTQSA